MSHPLHGRWREHWGGGERNELAYSDELEITGDPPGLVAIERPAYRFDDVVIADDRLTFTLINQRDPDDPFVIRYELAMTAEGELTGRATTNRGVSATIRWTRHC